jgi:hypothetical protein
LQWRGPPRARATGFNLKAVFMETKAQAEVGSLKARCNAAALAPTDAVAAAMHGLLADVFALCLKTKNLPWHVSGETEWCAGCLAEAGRPADATGH